MTLPKRQTWGDVIAQSCHRRASGAGGGGLVGLEPGVCVPLAPEETAQAEGPALEKSRGPDLEHILSWAQLVFSV